MARSLSLGSLHKLEIDRYVDAGDAVVALGRTRAHAACAAMSPTGQAFAMVFAISDGRVVTATEVSETPRTPSKPWACGSRRCRRRTWSWFGASMSCSNRGDFERMYALADPPPEFEYVPNMEAGPDIVGVERGCEGFRRVVEVFWDEFDDPHIELDELTTLATRCLSRPASGGVESRAAPR